MNPVEAMARGTGDRSLDGRSVLRGETSEDDMTPRRQSGKPHMTLQRGYEFQGS